MILQCTQHVLQWEETLKLDPFQVLVGDMRVEEVEALVASDPAVVGNNTAINQTNGKIYYLKYSCNDTGMAIICTSSNFHLCNNECYEFSFNFVQGQGQIWTLASESRYWW